MLPAGSFLVRFSTTQPGTFTISSSANSSIKHQRVTYDASKTLYHFCGEMYQSLDDIIRQSSNMFIPCTGSKYQALLFGDQDSRPNYIGYS